LLRSYNAAAVISKRLCIAANLFVIFFEDKSRGWLAEIVSYVHALILYDGSSSDFDTLLVVKSDDESFFFVTLFSPRNHFNHCFVMFG